MFKFLRTKINGLPKRQAVSIFAALSSEEDRLALRHAALRRPHWELAVAESAEEIGGRNFAVVLCDRDLPGYDWRQSVHELAKRSPCILLVSPVTDDSLWREVVEQGGYDVLLKPFEEETVLRTIDRALWYSEATAHVVTKK